MKTDGGGTTLSSRIFQGMAAFALSSMVVFALSALSVFYLAHEQEAETGLMADADALAIRLDGQSEDGRLAYLPTLPASSERCTLIAWNGEVLYDSKADAHTMENHADRQEFQRARTEGGAIAVRHSETVGTDTVYAAKRLRDGSVIRLSETRESLASLLQRMAVPLGLMAVAIAVAAFWLARVLARRITQPINAMDLENPSADGVYSELRPLLGRISHQQTQMRAQNDELERAVEARRDFSANVSHEMKTPLQVIGGYAELIEQGAVRQDDIPRFAGLILKESQQMRSLIDDVLMLSRLDESALGEAEIGDVDLGAILDQVHLRLAPIAAQRGIDVEIRADEGPLQVRGSETLLSEMAYNLMDNAIRYNHPGGRVDVALARTKNAVWLTVADTGPGIPPEARKKVFERFYRLEEGRSRETGGTGLGLAIVKHTAQRYGGTVAVSGNEAGGSTFTVSLPAAPQVI